MILIYVICFNEMLPLKLTQSQSFQMIVFPAIKNTGI